MGTSRAFFPPVYLLAGSEETSAGKRAACEEDGVPRPGQLMEVELLLLKFKQSVSFFNVVKFLQRGRSYK